MVNRLAETPLLELSGSDIVTNEETPQLSIVLPAYNEQQNIAGVLLPLLTIVESRNWELLVINDGSTDCTREILMEFEAQHTSLRVISHPTNRGYGAALKTGIRYCRAPLVATMDSDGQHGVEELLSLLTDAEQYQMVVGARTGLFHSPVWRMPGKWFLGRMANYLAHQHIPDLNSGLRIFHTAVIRQYLHLCPNGFSFSTTSTLILLDRNYIVKYVPITVRARLGKSSVSIGTGLNTIMLILRLVMLLNPLRIFLPLSFGSIIFGIVWAIPYLLDRQGLTVTSLLFIMNGIIVFLVGLLADQVAELRKTQFEEPHLYDR